MTKDLDNFLDRFIEALVLSFPLVLIVLVLWFQAGAPWHYYAPAYLYSAVYAVLLASTLMSVTARLIGNSRVKGILFVVSLSLYSLSILLLGSFLILWMAG